MTRVPLCMQYEHIEVRSRHDMKMFRHHRYGKSKRTRPEKRGT